MALLVNLPFFALGVFAREVAAFNAGVCVKTKSQRIPNETKTKMSLTLNYTDWSVVSLHSHVSACFANARLLSTFCWRPIITFGPAACSA
jgi:hypothetical protein